MRVLRFDRGAAPAELRALSPAPADVEEGVRAILAEVRAGGDHAVRRLDARFGAAAEALRVPEEEMARAARELDPDVAAALRAALANVEAVARAQLREPVRVALPDGQVVEVTEQPVRRAGAYVPGGRAPYPSSALMCAATARAAGVASVAVCTPPGADGRAHTVTLAACALCGVEEVYATGGAQAVALLAFGSDTVAAVDVVVGPGSPWVQEAKRQLAGVVGIDGVAGPSELVVAASSGADPQLVAIDLLAQGEHGADTLLVAVSGEATLLDEIAQALDAERASVLAETVALVQVEDAQAAVELADALAPEHVQLVGEEVEALAGRVRSAGCLFVGRDAATAFGDYVAGSNHVLPTGGAARHASALSPATFRRRMARVSLPRGAAARLAPAGDALARAEGFPVHGESMLRRA